MAVRRACGSAAGPVPGAGVGVQVADEVHVGEGDGVHVGAGVQVGTGTASWAGRGLADRELAGIVPGDADPFVIVLIGTGPEGTSRDDGTPPAGGVPGSAGVTGAGAPIRRVAQAGLRTGRARDWSAWPDRAPDDSRSSRTQPESSDTPFPTFPIEKGSPGSFRVSDASAPRGSSTTSVTNASRLSRMRPAASFLLVSPADVRRRAGLPRRNYPD